MSQISEFLSNSVSFGFFITLTIFVASCWLYNKTKFVLLSPLLVSSAAVIIVLVVFRIPYEKYLDGADFLYYLMTPVTVALAIPLYRQFQKLKENAIAILLGIISGILSNAFFVLAICIVFKIGHNEYVSLLPKSITTPIAVAITNQNHGLEAVTILMVSIAGNLCNVFAIFFCRIFRITEPVARGVACGTSGHAMGTSKALEMGDVEGAMSGLSIAVCGILTVIILPFFMKLI
ncbi:MAG: LrgB family protein [Treponema sp.]|nr:LrgB family protein [Treponema sp.]